MSQVNIINANKTKQNTETTDRTARSFFIIGMFSDWKCYNYDATDTTIKKHKKSE